MKNVRTSETWFITALRNLVEEAIDTTGQVNWPQRLLSLPPNAPALLVQTLRAWIRTLREKNACASEGVIHPGFLHNSSYNSTVLALISHGLLFRSRNAKTFGLTLPGLRLALEAEAIVEILQEYSHDEIAHAVTALLRIASPKALKAHAQLLLDV